MSPAAFAVHSLCTGNNQNLNMISEQRAMVIHFTVAAMSVIKGGWAPRYGSCLIQCLLVFKARQFGEQMWAWHRGRLPQGQTRGNALTSGLRTVGRLPHQPQPTAQICSRIMLIQSAQSLIETRGVMPSISSSQKCGVRLWNGSGWHNEWKLTTKEDTRLCYKSTSSLVRSRRKYVAEILNRWVHEHLGTLSTESACHGAIQSVLIKWLLMLKTQRAYKSCHHKDGHKNGTKTLLPQSFYSMGNVVFDLFIMLFGRAPCSLMYKQSCNIKIQPVLIVPLYAPNVRGF